MAEMVSTEALKNICAIVEERDNLILEKDIKIKYYKNATEKALDEIKYLEKEKKRIEDDDKTIQKQLEQLEFIEKSVKESQEIGEQSLLNHQYFEKVIAKELETKEMEKQRIIQEFDNRYSDTKKKLQQNPLYRQVEKKRVEFLNLDIKRRSLEVKIRKKKRIIKQKTDFQKKMFYNFFVKMAETHLIGQRLKELEKLKAEELEAVKNLYEIQKEVKLRQSLGTSRDRRIVNIRFGAQESQKPENKIEPFQPKKELTFNEKLNNMFQEDEPKDAVAPKVRILNQKIIVPAFEAPTIALPDNRKSKIIDISRKWHKLMKNSSFSKDLSKSHMFSDQQSEKQLSQSSQQSQLSQRSQISQRSQLSQQSGDQLMAKPNSIIKNPEPSIETGTCQKPQALNIVEEQITPIDNSQLSPPVLQDYSTPLKSEKVSKLAVSEPSKSVRFNLELNSQQTDNRSMFVGQPMFGNIFSPFPNRAPVQTEIMEQDSGANEATLNMSLMDPTGGISHTSPEYDAGANRSQVRSPEFTFDLEGGEEQPSYKPLEMPPFGRGGGFFSFGGAKNMFNPF